MTGHDRAGPPADGPVRASGPARPAVRWTVVSDPALLAALADSIFAVVSPVDANDEPRAEPC